MLATFPINRHVDWKTSHESRYFLFEFGFIYCTLYRFRRSGFFLRLLLNRMRLKHEGAKRQGIERIEAERKRQRKAGTSLRTPPLADSFRMRML